MNNHGTFFLSLNSPLISAIHMLDLRKHSKEVLYVWLWKKKE